MVDSPPKRADSLAGGSPAPSTVSEGGGPMGVVERGDEDDVLSLHPNDMLQPLIPTPQQPVDNKFRQYHAIPCNLPCPLAGVLGSKNPPF